MGKALLDQAAVEYQKWDALRHLEHGDKVKLTDGSTAEFVRLKQKNFIGIMDGKSYDIPVTMFKEVIEIAPTRAKARPDLMPNEPFYIADNRGNAILFLFKEHRNNKIVGINPVDKASVTIPVAMYRGKVADLK